GRRRRRHEDGKRAAGATGRARQGDCGRTRHLGRSRSRPCSDRIVSTREQRFRMDTRPPDTDAKAPPPQEPQEPQKPRRRRRVPRLVVRAGAVLLAIVVSLLLTALTVDLGPAVRKRAEDEGSKYLRRPLHLGRVSARLIPGVFVFENLVIEGLAPDARPFLTAKKVTVRLPWWTIASRNLIVES